MTPHTPPLPPETQRQATGHGLACIKVKSITWNLYFSWGRSSILLGKPESAKFISLLEFRHLINDICFAKVVKIKQLASCQAFLLAYKEIQVFRLVIRI